MPRRFWVKKKKFLSLLLLVLPFFCRQCHAETLSSLLELAISNEPTYLSAKAALQGANARTDQAKGGLLPQINVSINTNYNNRDYQTRGANAQRTQDQYNSNSQQVNLTQPIWRLPNEIGLKQAKSATDQAEQQLENTEQELLTKLVSAWFDLLGARDQVLFAQQQIALSEHLKEVAQRGFKLGYIGQPELDDVAAKLEQAKADQVAAETGLSLKEAVLEQIIGNTNQLSPTFMRENAELANLSNSKLEDMLAKVESGNHNILAAMLAYKAASDEVDKQNAGHFPTLDLVASYGNNSQPVGSFPGQAGYDIKLGTVGVQLNIPIYSGGTQSAKVKEAVAQKEKMRLDIEVAKRAAILSAKQAWYDWRTVFTKARAFEQAIKAANTALRAATVAENNGLESERAVLEARQKLSEAQLNYNHSRYEQVVDFVKLKSLMGVLTNEDIAALDTLLVDKPADSGTPRIGQSENGRVD